MKKSTHWVKNLTRTAVIAALYTVLTIVLSPIGYGPIQCRVAEAMTVLPVFSLVPVWGLTIGCLLSNMFAIFTGNTIAGVWDILFGTLATLVAALLSYKFRNVRYKGLPLLSLVFPVVLNGVVIGAELTIVEVGKLAPKLYAFNALTVSAGQLVACFIGGLILFKAFEKTKLFQN